MEQDFKKNFITVLQECDRQSDNIDAILSDKLVQAQIASPDEILKNIDLILDSIDRKHAALIYAKQNGMSRAAWMRQEFSAQVDKIGEDKTAAVLDVVNDSMQGKDVVAEPPDANTSFTGLDAVEKIRNLDRSLVALTCQAQEEVQSVVAQDDEETATDSVLMKKAVVDKDPVAFKQVRKIATVCLMSDGGDLAIMNYANAAVMADRSVFAVQQEYAVGAGECTEADAVENLIDRYAAQLCGIVESYVPQIIDAGMKALTTLATAYCPAAVPVLTKITPVLKAVCTVALTKVIRKGAELIKKTAKNCWQKIKSAHKSLAESVNKVVSFMNND